MKINNLTKKSPRFQGLKFREGSTLNLGVTPPNGNIITTINKYLSRFFSFRFAPDSPEGSGCPLIIGGKNKHGPFIISYKHDPIKIPWFVSTYEHNVTPTKWCQALISNKKKPPEGLSLGKGGKD